MIQAPGSATIILNEITKTSGVSTVSISTSDSTLGLPSPFYSEKVCISVTAKAPLVSFLSCFEGLQTRSGKAFSFQNFFGHLATIRKGLVVDQTEGPEAPVYLGNP